MTFPTEPIRLAALSVACLGLMYVLMILFQSDNRAWVDGAKMWLPFLVATVPPYLIILWRLSSRPDDAIGLGFAVACGSLAAVLLVGSVVRMGRDSLSLIVGLGFWHLTLLTAMVVFLPLQIKLVSSSYAILAASGAGRAAGMIGLGAIGALTCAVVAAGVVAPLADGTGEGTRGSAYSETAATAHLFKLYDCLWREAGPGAVNGFPASEEALRARGPDCWDPASSPGGTAYGTHYEFRYLPGAPDEDGVIRSFAIATKKVNRRGTWTDSFHLDHLGILRRSVEEWATPETDRIESFKRSIVPTFAGVLDAYHDVHGTYPVRILDSSESGDARPHDLVITGRELSVRSIRPGSDGTTIIERHDARIVYAPALSARGGGATAYRFTIRGGREGIRDLRSYLMDTDGRIHATGEDRDATAADPVAPDIEWAQGAREGTRARLAPIFAASHASAR